MTIKTSHVQVTASEKRPTGQYVSMMDSDAVTIGRTTTDGLLTVGRDQAIWLSEAILRVIAEYDAERARWHRDEAQP